MPEVPAICEQCGAVYAGPRLGGEGASFFFVDTIVDTGMGAGGPGQCPHCGGRISIPNGAYQVVGDTLKVTTLVSGWSSERLSKLVDAINDARQSPNSQQAVEGALKSEPELYNFLKNRIIPREPASFWTAVAVLVAVLNMLLHSGPNVTINERTVIEQIRQSEPRGQIAQPPVPRAHPQPDPAANKPPRCRTQQRKWDRAHRKHRRPR